jgi:3-deoxy-manno-octulosonate cytidylyltransferase (CMP-KDO synthetase)
LGNALYFSRSPIPYRRNPEAQITYYKHIGIYGYLAQVLTEITRLPQGAIEKAESLEQLRWLENGYAIRLKETDMETISIDTPNDLIKAEAYLRVNK